MRNLMDVAPKVLEDAYKIQTLIERNQPVYSFDNWSGHEQAVQALHLDLKEGTRAPLPAKSPDMHKVIEHVFNTVQNEFGKRLWLHPGKHEMSTYLAVLEDILFNFITVESVRRDVESLPRTYDHIMTPVADGGRGGQCATHGFN
jgi:hypothetical protein